MPGLRMAQLQLSMPACATSYSKATIVSTAPILEAPRVAFFDCIRCRGEA